MRVCVLHRVCDCLLIWPGKMHMALQAAHMPAASHMRAMHGQGALSVLGGCLSLLGTLVASALHAGVHALQPQHTVRALLLQEGGGPAHNRWRSVDGTTAHIPFM